MRWYLIGFWLAFPWWLVMLSIFSWAHWPSVWLPWILLWFLDLNFALFISFPKLGEFSVIIIFFFQIRSLPPPLSLLLLRLCHLNIAWFYLWNPLNYSFLKILFSFCYFCWVISTTLSPRLLIRSSASSSLLLIPLAYFSFQFLCSSLVIASF